MTEMLLQAVLFMAFVDLCLLAKIMRRNLQQNQAPRLKVPLEEVERVKKQIEQAARKGLESYIGAPITLGFSNGPKVSGKIKSWTFKAEPLKEKQDKFADHPFRPIKRRKP